jgi:hypothetical protein
MSENSALNATPQLLEKKEVIGIFDFGIHGGAIDTAGIELSGLFGLNPGEALADVKINVIEAVTSDGSATVSLGTEATDPDNILEDTAVASLTQHAVLDGIQVPQTIATWVVNTGTTFLPIKAQVKTAALTAGKFAVIATIKRIPSRVA